MAFKGPCQPKSLTLLKLFFLLSQTNMTRSIWLESQSISNYYCTLLAKLLPYECTLGLIPILYYDYGQTVVPA